MYFIKIEGTILIEDILSYAPNISNRIHETKIIGDARRHTNELPGENVNSLFSDSHSWSKQ